MPGGLSHPAAVVGLDYGSVRQSVHLAVQEDDRSSEPAELVDQVPTRLVGRGDDKRVNLAVSQQAGHFGVPVGIAARGGDDRRISQPAQHVLGGGDYRTEQGVAQVGDDESDRAAAARAKAGCEQVGFVAQFGDRLEHPGTHVLADVRVVVQHAGHG